MTTANIDPRLSLALKQAKPGTLVQAILTLGGNEGKLLSKQDVDQIYGQILKTAQAKSGTQPHRKKIMYNLQTVALEADARFLKSALDSDYIQSAMLNALP
jgi:hypothetical protein